MNTHMKLLLVIALSMIGIAVFGFLALLTGQGEGFGAVADAFWLPGLMFLAVFLAVRALGRK